MSPTVIRPKGNRVRDPPDPERLPETIDLESLLIRSRRGNLDVRPALITGKLDRTITRASTVTLTLLDPDRKILKHPALRARKAPGSDGREGRFFDATMLLSGIEFRLVAVDVPQSRRTVLTFEDETIYQLRLYWTPRSASRGSVTRAEFFAMLCDQAQVDFFCPEIHEKQKKAPREEDPSPSRAERKRQADLRELQEARDRNREPGLADGVKLKIKKSTATAEQRRHIEIALDVARKEKAGPLATLAMVCAGIGESEFRPIRNQGNPPSDYGGVFQGRVVANANGPKWFDLDDTAEQAHYFLRGGKGFQGGGAIALARKGMSAPEIALTVEGSVSNFQGNRAKGIAHYDYREQARKIIAAYAGGDLDDGGDVDDGAFSAGDPGEYTVSYQFRRGVDGKPETSWDAMRRMADEVDWYLFAVAGRVYFLSGPYLRRSRARMIIEEGAPGIESVTGTVDQSPKREDRLTVKCRAAAWQAPPGTVVIVRDYGPMDDRWVVAQITRDKLASTATTITLERINRKAPEPAAEVRQRSADSEGLREIDEARARRGRQPIVLSQPLGGSGDNPWGVLPHVGRSGKDVQQRFKVTSIGGYRAAEDGGEHPRRRALDFMCTHAQGDLIADYLIKNAKAHKIKYVIWRQRIWNVEQGATAWRMMEDRGNPTQNHMDHVHASYLEA